MQMLFDPAEAIGLVLAISRAGAFAAASPMTKALPIPGRLAFAIGIGLALAHPVSTPGDLGGFLAAAVINAGIGLVLGFLTGLILVAFQVAGSISNSSTVAKRTARSSRR